VNQFDFFAVFIYNIKHESQTQGGTCMTRSKQILSLAEQHHGVVTTAMVVSAGLPRGSLKYLADTGRLDRASRGVYILPDVCDDEMVNIQSRYKRGIFSLNTALFLCDLTDRTPRTFHMTFPNTYNLTGPKRYGILCHGTKEPLYSLGVEDLKTPGGNSVRAYGAERTLCDILKPQSRTDIQMIADAFKRYVARKDRNIPLLSEYARILGVEKRVRTYLEVLL
jgi:predicted transcriptional regulator of viral defense system